MCIQSQKYAIAWVAFIALASVSAVGIADEAVAVSSQRDLNKEARECARLLWSVIDTLQQQCILLPSRDELISGIHVYLTSRRNPDGDLDLQRMRRSQNADEFAEAFLVAWQYSSWNQKPVGPFVDGALEQVAKVMGGHVRLVKAKDYVVEEQLQNNRYVGLGVNLSKESQSGHPQFMRIMPGGPAERAGLEDGVTITAIDGRSTAGVDLMEILDWLRGPKGSQVTLTVLPNGKHNGGEVTLTRGVIRIDSVFGMNGSPLGRNVFRNEVSDPVGHLAISNITGSTVSELRGAEVRIQGTSIRALVLDFRSHGQADDIHHARLLADALLDGGTIWTYAERGQDPRVEVADRECLFRNIPLVIAIDENSGVAHLAVAAALQDAGRAVIVGPASDYNGLVSAAVRLPGDQYYLKFPSARLIRSRPDRSWPLQADRVVEAPGMRPRLRAFRADADPASSAISALMPSNLTPQQWQATMQAYQKLQDPLVHAKEMAVQLLNRK